MVPKTEFERMGVERLREAGYRITSSRVKCLRALEGSKRALSAQEVYDAVKAMGERVDLVTVYRVLRVLAETHVVHHIGAVDGFIPCCMNHEHAQASQHWVCRSCGNVSEIDVPDEWVKNQDSRARELGFRPEEFRVELLGLCSSCSA